MYFFFLAVNNTPFYELTRTANRLSEEVYGGWKEKQQAENRNRLENENAFYYSMPYLPKRVTKIVSRRLRTVIQVSLSHDHRMNNTSARADDVIEVGPKACAVRTSGWCRAVDPFSDRTSLPAVMSAAACPSAGRPSQAEIGVKHLEAIGKKSIRPLAAPCEDESFGTGGITCGNPRHCPSGSLSSAPVRACTRPGMLCPVVTW